MLETDAALLLQIAQVLWSEGQVSQQKMAGLQGVRVAREELMLMHYADLVEVFSLQRALVQCMACNPLRMQTRHTEQPDALPL